MKARKLIKKGRPRKEVSRKGKSARIVHEDPRKAVLDQPHRRAFRSVKIEGDPKPKDLRGAPEAHDVFGRLFLSGEITAPQRAAGIIWLEAYLRYCRVLGIPTGRIKGTLAQTIRGVDNADIEPAQARNIKAKYAAICATMFDALGPRTNEARDMLVTTLVHDRHPDQWGVGVLREALNAIGKRA